LLPSSSLQCLTPSFIPLSCTSLKSVKLLESWSTGKNLWQWN
jgi:hypothetical protein